MPNTVLDGLPPLPVFELAVGRWAIFGTSVRQIRQVVPATSADSPHDSRVDLGTAQAGPGIVGDRDVTAAFASRPTALAVARLIAESEAEYRSLVHDAARNHHRRLVAILTANGGKERRP